MTNPVDAEEDDAVAPNREQGDSHDENISIVERFVADVWNNRDVALAKSLLAPEYLVHFYGLPVMGYDDYFDYFPGQLETWPDIKVTVEHTFADGEWVSIRFAWTGTHVREAFGIPPTGKVVKGGGIASYRVRAGQVIEAWICEDMLSTLRMMGGGPGPS